MPQLESLYLDGGLTTDEGLGKLHFFLTFIGSQLNFLPMHWAGLMGMPRRVASYDPEVRQIAVRGDRLGKLTVLVDGASLWSE